LRSVRRGLKQDPDIADVEVRTLRKRVADVELLSEQVEQAMLYRVTGQLGRRIAEPEVALRSNIAAILASRGTDTGAFPLPKLHAAASAAGD
jgi:hypothetical protein